MKMVHYGKEDAEFALKKYQQLLGIINELERMIPDRHFTMDGHLIGSIGEVLASYHYGIGLYNSSTKEYDGETLDGNKRVQIKVTQREQVLISGKPEYLLVLYLSTSGEVYEVYSGYGENATRVGVKDKRGYFHVTKKRLTELNKASGKKIVATVPVALLD